MNNTATQTASVLLKIHHLTGSAWRVEMLSLRGVSLGNLVDVLDCAQEHVTARAESLAAERGMTVLATTIALGM